MNEDNFIKLDSFFTKIKNDGTIDLPDKVFKKILHRGFDEIRIDIYGNIEQAIKNSEIQPDIFYKIKSIQKIPDNVVLNFLNTKGRLYTSNIKERIKY